MDGGNNVYVQFMRGCKRKLTPLVPDYTASLDRANKGIPIGRPPEVNLSNNHLQYIFTWFVNFAFALLYKVGNILNASHRYSLSLATTYMFYLLVRRSPRSIASRVRTSRQW